MRQVLEISRAHVSQGLAEAIVAMLCKNHKRAELLGVLPHQASVLHVHAQGVTHERYLRGRSVALHAQRHVGLVAQVKEHTACAVIAPVVKRYEEALLVLAGSVGGGSPAEVIDAL